MEPVMVAAASAEATDDQLVAATRAGSDGAFETLFRRYRERVKAYVGGMTGDEARSEDVVQETFISALRSLRSTDQPIAFKPWIYQIARNAGIDHLRRLKRAEEVSIYADDLEPRFEAHLSETASGTESTVSRRQDIENLRQAFGGLPDSQYRILVLRELEGLSYEEIADRMDLSSSAVESMLFRARRGLKGEYQDIATGARCRRVQTVIAQVAEGLGGLRDRRMLVRHVRECATCRREAAIMGIGGLGVETGRRRRTRAALSRVAALLPIPPFFHRRSGSSAPAETLASPARRLYELGTMGGAGAEQAATAVQKAVAVIAAAVVVAGGVAAEKTGAGPTPSPAQTGGAAGSGSSALAPFSPQPGRLGGQPGRLGGQPGLRPSSTLGATPVDPFGAIGGGLGTQPAGAGLAPGLAGAVPGSLIGDPGRAPSIALPGALPGDPIRGLSEPKSLLEAPLGNRSEGGSSPRQELPRLAPSAPSLPDLRDGGREAPRRLPAVPAPATPTPNIGPVPSVPGSPPPASGGNPLPAAPTLPSAPPVSVPPVPNPQLPSLPSTSELQSQVGGLTPSLGP